MARARNGNVEIEYESFGPRSGRPLLLVMGLGAQMTHWHEDLVGLFVDHGHHVVRFDNRDVGLSTHLDDAGVPDMATLASARLAGQVPRVPYTLDDMAADAVAVLDAVGIDQAHICGASLGGMIVQTMALRHRDRVRSLTSIMSSTGNPALPPPKPEAMGALMAPPARSREEVAARAVATARVIGSPGFPTPEDELVERALKAYDRAFNPGGVARQMAAATVQPNRRPLLEAIDIPALVIHGAADPLVPVTSGIDTHEALRGSELHVIDGFGHDLPRAVWPQVVERIAALTARA